jgi:hypothetical protein
MNPDTVILISVIVLMSTISHLVRLHRCGRPARFPSRKDDSGV